MDQADIPALLARLSSEEDAMRKMAVFKLQSSINDPSFADVFISSGGLVILRRLIMTTSGNTLAYSLQCLTRLLEVDMGWEIFESAYAGELVERVVELIVTHPLVNILRGAMSILVAIVGHSQSGREEERGSGAFGFRALKPAVAVYPEFFEMVVNQLNSADHALCANSMMLLNALMRDAIAGESTGKEGRSKAAGTTEEWPKFIKRLQDLGVVKSAYSLMQSSALQDLAHPLLEFQTLTKILLRRWRDMKVDLDVPEHRRALKGLHLASAPEKKTPNTNGNIAAASENGTKEGKKHNPEKWRRLGFETESPAWEFDPTGFLGMMDLTDYVRKQEDGFQKLLLEQSSRPMHERCPFARASLAVTAILYEHFDMDKTDDDARNYLILDGLKNYDRVFKPLLLQWSKLHAAGLHAFFRLWKATGAEQDDFDKIAELVRILTEHVVGLSTRTRNIADVEEEFAEFEYSRLRDLQMELLGLTFDDQWGGHLQQMKDGLRGEALQFVKEQRIRCLLAGSWFPRASIPKSREDGPASQAKHSWRFAKLSHNRRFLHYADYQSQSAHDPSLEQLQDRIDLNTISSVVSNVSATPDDRSSISTTSTLRELSVNQPRQTSTTKITINSFGPATDDTADGEPAERAILTLSPQNHSLASEWLDGLLMLLNQAPITAETNKLVTLVTDYGLKIRLLNVRMDNAFEVPVEGGGVVPSRDGLDEDYYYEV